MSTYPPCPVCERRHGCDCNQLPQTPMHFQEESEESARVYDADRPHAPTLTEQERFWKEHGQVHAAMLGVPPAPASAPDAPATVGGDLKDHPLVGEWLKAIAENRQREREAVDADPLAPTVSELIDRLCIVHCKMFALIEKIEQGEDDAAVAEAARKVARLNRERSALKNGIERHLSGADAKQEVKV